MARTLKVIVGGTANVGKTSLICQYTKGRFFDARNLTLGVDITTHEFPIGGEPVKLAIFDVEGAEGHRSGFYLGAQAGLFVYDVMDPASFEALPQWVDRFRKYCLNAPLLIVGNKCDLGQKVPPSWTAALARYARAHQTGYASARTGEGVPWVFETLALLATRQAATGPQTGRLRWHPAYAGDTAHAAP